ncbi:DUF1993 domain-containing protein [Aspergillus luchuensis]|uniref:DUF1993 domain-containing protein n=2 Tax=Aspergillus kawachii TaxID=1069201 RepID=A0A1M3THR7_ASPLC|nr:uncharacterized protein AKAW2_70689S [Aspergillus luchuensis]OJZ86304.1 hypothetical protein ASPFODRAFT_45737 [Aspergillus luchuensis CBS 106.47]GAA89357.1 similar to An16g08680 [Aspergillus luchuensis IFO 4308]BCS03811.1 hypothetical protein AKAW2_70689S [Aspergillus luchuensis]BCS15426.1 hypothetical protein ALUC_70659S [Aspergillus luchuensis]GAT28969.1 similar to An16g08680 [Aspergillus luchuensis]
MSPPKPTSTLYATTLPILTSILKTLLHLLRTAERTHSNPSSLLLNSRLHPTMYPLTDQIRLVTSNSVRLYARLTNHPEADTLPTTFLPEGNPQSFAECYERIDKVLELLKDADNDATTKEVVNSHAETVKPAPAGPGVEIDVTNATYAHTMVLPNIYFHLNIAYAIVRMEGVEIGKRDLYAGFGELWG